MSSENVWRKGITKCYKLYLIPVIVPYKAAYTANYPIDSVYDGTAEHLLTMKTQLRILSIALLLALGAAHAHAESNRQDWRNELRAMHQQPRDPQAARPPQQTAQPSGRLTGSEGQSNAPANEASDQSRKSGRMTAEERRALRRQINEAGRDIYTSSH